MDICLDLCTYCGAPANSIDHVVPQHLLERIPEEELRKQFKFKNWTVPACLECNCRLSGQVYKTLKARRQAAQDSLERKHKRLLKIPEWTNEELAEMGPNMQHYIEQGLIQKKELKSRLTFRRASRRRFKLIPGLR